MEKKRYYYIDILNCIAIFFVLMLHSTQLSFSGDPNSIRTITCNVIQVICIPAVYIFFMNSGAMLVNYRERQSTKTFAIKRIRRVLIPFLCWSFFYYLFDLRFIAAPGPIIHKNPSVKDFILGLVNNNINNIFWFFYAIMAIYITLPIISLAAKKHKDYLFFIVFLSFFLNDFANWIGGIFNVKLQSEYFNFTLMIYLPYALIGYLVKESYFSRKQENLIIIAGLLSVICSVVDVVNIGKLSVFNHIGPMLYSTSIYLIIKRLSYCKIINKRKFKILFMHASGCSLSMYVLHVLFYKWFDTFLHINNTSWIHIILMPFIVYTIGTIIIYIVRKFRFIRVFMP
ncbi:acyltransferase [Limosilactobacillus coleohominis]|uniref:acyltransferase n=1 Tax=Limosilactobacillus coleohominis TaxID=181675 RepID=UPI00195777EB|nr:acyltransferase [Limosilactobacillus coleohominis]MBM6955335.1 acyltransferase [Limosilactobacillus coleohominis]